MRGRSTRFWVLLFLSYHSSDCSDDGVDHEKDKYREPPSWTNYRRFIDEAFKEADVSECKTEGASRYFDVIESDLKPWKNGISGAKFKESLKLRSQSRATHYQIIDHKLYREEDCMFPFRCKGIEHFILKLLPELPDLELLVNTRDHPMISRWRGDDPAPLFSFSKPPNHYLDIMYPAWTFWEGGPAVWPIYPTGLGRWDQQIKIIGKKAKEWPWRKKQSVAFFRGSRTSEERDPLVLLSRHRPELVDAQYTKNQAWKSDKDTLGMPPATEVPLEDHCQYKYLFNFRGVAASFRFKHLFLCNSLVFHVGPKDLNDDWLEFFYSAMKPWLHYVPVSAGMEEAEDLLRFFRDNHDYAKKIAKRGRKFILDHLRMEDVTSYWRRLLTRYARLIQWKPVREKDFHLVVE